SSRRRHTRFSRDWSSDVCSSDLVLIPPASKGGAKPGQYVEVRITHWPTMSRQAQGEVIEVVGDYMAPGVEIEVALRSYDIPSVWPQEVLDEAARLPDHVVEKDKAKRVD